MVKISVVISTYNRADVLPRAIESVLKQTFSDFELIIIDDGSTDRTREIVENFERKDNRVRYIYQENSGGPSSPKNTGIKNAQGEYIAILDSDDEWMPEKLAKQMALFNENPNLGFVSCNSIVVDGIRKKEWVYKIPRYKKSEIFENIMARDYMGSGSGMVYKKSVFSNVGFFDENLKSSQDKEMRMRLAQEYEFDFIDESLFKYYVHKENRSKVLGIEGKEKDHEYIFEKYRKYYEGHPKIYSNKLRYDGTRYVLAGDTKKARRSFYKSVGLNIFNCRSYLYLFLSFFGIGIYYGLNRFKAKIKNRS